MAIYFRSGDLRIAAGLSEYLFSEYSHLTLMA
jgi:hypothetical protein